MSELKYNPVTRQEAALLRKVAAANILPGRHRKFLDSNRDVRELTDKMRSYLALIAYRYRPQYELTRGDWAFIDRFYSYSPPPQAAELQLCGICRTKRYSCTC